MCDCLHGTPWWCLHLSASITSFPAKQTPYSSVRHLLVWLMWSWQGKACYSISQRAFLLRSDYFEGKRSWNRGQDEMDGMCLVKMTCGRERGRTHLHSVSIFTGAILDSSTSAGCQWSMGTQALAQALSGARLSSAWRDDTDNKVCALVLMWYWTLKTDLV